MEHMMMMGMGNKKGHDIDVPSKGEGVMHPKKKLRNKKKHRVMAHKGMGMIAAGRRRLGNCSKLMGRALSRCRGKVMGGCNGLMGLTLKKCKAHRRRNIRLESDGRWILVKKNHGGCECTQNPMGQIVIGRFHSEKECEHHRSHDC